MAGLLCLRSIITSPALHRNPPPPSPTLGVCDGDLSPLKSKIVDYVNPLCSPARDMGSWCMEKAKGENCGVGIRPWDRGNALALWVSRSSSYMLGAWLPAAAHREKTQRRGIT